MSRGKFKKYRIVPSADAIAPALPPSAKVQGNRQYCIQPTATPTVSDPFAGLPLFMSADCRHHRCPWCERPVTFSQLGQARRWGWCPHCGEALRPFLDPMLTREQRRRERWRIRQLLFSDGFAYSLYLGRQRQLARWSATLYWLSDKNWRKL